MIHKISSFTLLAVTPFFLSCQSLPHNKNIEIVSMTRAIDTSAPDHQMCSSFTLTKENIATYFSKANEIHEQEFHHEAMILPCKYQGSIRIDGQYLQWEIFAGGAGYLYNNKTINKRYLCKKDCCNSLPNLC